MIRGGECACSCARPVLLCLTRHPTVRYVVPDTCRLCRTDPKVSPHNRCLFKALTCVRWTLEGAEYALAIWKCRDVFTRR